MLRRFRYTFLFFISLLILGGCDALTKNKPKPSAPLAAGEAAERANAESANKVTPKPIEDLFVEITEQVPGFGGVYYTEEGTVLNIVLQDTTQREAAIAALDPLRRCDENACATSLGLSEPEAIRVVKGTYSFAQLNNFKRLARSLWGAGYGIQSLDADEMNNRLSIGVSPNADISTLETLLQSLGVPLEAVTFVEVSSQEQDARSKAAHLHGEAVNTVGLRVEAVIGALVLHVEQDEQTARQPYREAGDIDDRVALLPDEVAVGNLEVVSQHGSLESG